MDLLVRLEKVIVFASSLFLAGAFCLIVVLRYGFHSDLFAYEEWVLTVAFLLYFIGGALASHEDVQIKADIIQEFLKNPRAKALYQGCLLLFEAAVGATLTYYCFFMLMNEFARWPSIPTTPVYKIPLAVPRFFILVGIALMSLHALLNGLRHLRMSRELPSHAGSQSVTAESPSDRRADP